MKALKETLKKQCDINHETVIAAQTLRRFNNKFIIVDMLKPMKEIAINERKKAHS